MALSEIVAHKKSELLKRKDDLARLIKVVKPTNKSLRKALAQAKSGFICEIKFASPSQGSIRTGIEAASIAKIYEPFANAISVLADEKFFGGSYDYVQEVSQTVSCPVLCKDVVVSAQQIYEARFYGADVVLLMLSVLDDDEFLQCATIAKKLNMDFICEVHNEEEMLRANNLKAPIIGINNRDLKTLNIDMSTSMRLVPLAHPHAQIILESGFYEHGQIKEFAHLAQGFLVGTSLMQADRIDLALRQLLFGRIKICGLTNQEDAHEAYKHGAYYGGLNFAPISKRVVNLEQAASVMKGAPLIWGGVFVNQPISFVADVAQTLGLSFVQLHGDEDQSYIANLRHFLPDHVELWKAFRVQANMDIPTYFGVDRMVLDGFVPGEFGGTGQAFDWSFLDSKPWRHDIVLAGGINPSNAKLAGDLMPFALDIASGVEDNDPRKKSQQKLQQLFYHLRP